MKRLLFALLSLLAASAVGQTYPYKIDPSTGQSLYHSPICWESAPGGGADACIGRTGAGSLGATLGSLSGGGGTKVRNVVTQYGAKGDTQLVIAGASVTNALATVTCASCNFTSADVGKQIWVFSNTGNTADFLHGTISSVASGVATTTGSGSSTASGLNVYWGTDDTTALVNATNDAVAASEGNATGQNASAGTVVYIPCGNYTVTSRPFDLYNGTGSQGVQILGASSTCVRIIPSKSFVGWANDGEGHIIRTANAGGWVIGGFTIQGYIDVNPTVAAAVVFRALNANQVANIKTPEARVQDLVIDSFSGSNQGMVALFVNGTNIHVFNSWFSSNDYNCSVNSGGGVTFFETYCGNSPSTATTNGANLLVSNIIGSQSAGGFKYIGGSIDECFQTSLACTRIVASKDVYFMGTTLWNAGSGASLAVDGTSVVNISDSVVGPYLNATNSTGITVASGGVVKISQSRVQGKGTGVGISNSGTVYDVGGNQWWYCTASGDTCAQATTAQAYSGTAPFSALTHSANTFVLPGTIAAVNFGNQTPDQAIQITKIQAITTGAATACTVAPVVTFTQGGTTATLTLTTAKTAWDSAVDTSTGLPAIFTSGTVFTASTTAGTCTTSPTNLSVTYTWQSVAPSN